LRTGTYDFKALNSETMIAHRVQSVNIRKLMSFQLCWQTRKDILFWIVTNKHKKENRLKSLREAIEQLLLTGFRISRRLIKKILTEAGKSL